VKQEQQVKIFCSYAHKDRSIARDLKAHFASLERLHSLFFWTDKEIQGGEEWEQAIREHLDSAQIILLLISPDFIASDYCYSKEMKRAMERHKQKEAWVIPILIRHVAHWRDAPFGKLQVLPAGGKPIIDRSWTRDYALSRVVEEISQAIGMSTKEKSISVTSIVSDVPSFGLLPDVLPPSQAASDMSLLLAGQKPIESASIQDRSEQPGVTSLPTPGPQSAGSPLVSEIPVATTNDEKYKITGIKIFEQQLSAYHFLIRMIECYGAEKAVMLQYSCHTGLNVLRVLLHKGAKVTVFIQHEDVSANIGSQFQAHRIIETTMNLRSELGDALLRPKQLKVYKYHVPSSISAIKIDDRILCIGWYTYEETKHPTHKTHPDDTMELSAHDRAAVVIWRGITDFQAIDENISTLKDEFYFHALDRTFSILEKNYRKYAEAVPV
jgi:hypothetical protein